MMCKIKMKTPMIVVLLNIIHDNGDANIHNERLTKIGIPASLLLLELFIITTTNKTNAVIDSNAVIMGNQFAYPIGIAHLLCFSTEFGHAAYYIGILS